MKKFYSKLTGGFYSSDIHGEDVPPSAVEISSDEYQLLMNGQSMGKVITSDSTGKPILVEQPSLTTEQLAEAVRTKRDEMITATDYLLMPDYPISIELLERVKVCRQALRDISVQTGFPNDIIWPAIPV